MGWTFTFLASRKSIIEECTKDWGNTNEDGTSFESKCLRHCTRGNVLWAVWEQRTIGPDGVKEDRFISCHLLQNGGEDGWGYKPMEECMGPYYYTCPLAYLEMVPVACEEWREGVRAYHAKRSRKIEKGASYRMRGVKPPYDGATVTVTSLRPLRGTVNGYSYRIQRKWLGEEVTV
jgi:hypothetical protein